MHRSLENGRYFRTRSVVPADWTNHHFLARAGIDAGRSLIVQALQVVQRSVRQRIESPVVARAVTAPGRGHVPGKPSPPGVIVRECGSVIRERSYRQRMVHEAWAVGDAYEAYVGRWSRRVAEVFVRWLDVPAGRCWLDVGCGTGALTATVLAVADAAEVIGVDTSEEFLADARAQIVDTRATFRAGDARSLPLPDRRFDAVVSGLALNFVPDPRRAAAEFARVATSGGIAAAYVWDYAQGMAMMRYFWDAAITLDPAAAELDEGRRFPLCRPEPLRGLWADAGLDEVTVQAIEVPTVFADFDDYWGPFLGGQGPAPWYAMSLTEEHRRALRDLLRVRLPSGPDGRVRLTARAWAVRGTARDEGSRSGHAASPTRGDPPR
jgi:SAM-dependent methyltransferase